MRVKTDHLSFSDWEIAVDAKKVAVKYRYYISMESISNMLLRLGYNPDAMYVQNGWWDIPSKSEYADSVQYHHSNVRVSGIGFFEDYNDKMPAIVVNTDKQQINICDSKHLTEINKKIFQDLISCTITFDLAFGEAADWDRILDELKEQSLNS